MRIRPMTLDDVPAAERVSAHAFHDVDLRIGAPGQSVPELRPPARAESWKRRLRHLVAHDAEGCWVAEDDDGRVVGQAIATVREGLWGLSSYAVLPGLQSRGLGKPLLEAALSYGDRDGPGYICASPDLRAVRRYRLAGFDLHPAMIISGTVRRSAIPALPHVREGGSADLELMDAVDRAVRGAAHGADHEVLLEQMRLLIVDRGGSRGYAYHRSDGSPYLLAATDPATAQELLWACLETASDDVPVEAHSLTAEQGWAIDVGLAARLEVHVYGFVALRNLAPPTPYIPSGHFL